MSPLGTEAVNETETDNRDIPVVDDTDDNVTAICQQRIRTSKRLRTGLNAIRFELIKLAEDNSELAEHQAELEALLLVTQQENAELQEENSGLAIQLDESAAVIEQQNTELAVSAKRIAMYRHKLGEDVDMAAYDDLPDNLISVLRNDLEQTVDELQHYEEAHDELEDANVDLQEDMADLMGQLEEQTRLAAKAATERDMFKQEAAELRVLRDEVDDELQETRARVQELLWERQAVGLEAGEAAPTADEIDAIDELHAAREELERLRKTATQQEEQIEALEDGLELAMGRAEPDTITDDAIDGLGLESAEHDASMPIPEGDETFDMDDDTSELSLMTDSGDESDVEEKSMSTKSPPPALNVPALNLTGLVDTNRPSSSRTPSLTASLSIPQLQHAVPVTDRHDGRHSRMSATTDWGKLVLRGAWATKYPTFPNGRVERRFISYNGVRRVLHWGREPGDQTAQLDIAHVRRIVPGVLAPHYWHGTPTSPSCTQPHMAFILQLRSGQCLCFCAATRETFLAFYTELHRDILSSVGAAAKGEWWASFTCGKLLWFSVVRRLRSLCEMKGVSVGQYLGAIVTDMAECTSDRDEWLSECHTISTRIANAILRSPRLG